MQHQVPRFGELLKCCRAAKPLLHVPVPIPHRDPAFLPILPAPVFFDGGPKFLRRHSTPASHPLHGSRHVDADEHASDIENAVATLPSRHAYLASPRATPRRARMTVISTGSTDTTTTTAIT